MRWLFCRCASVFRHFVAVNCLQKFIFEPCRTVMMHRFYIALFLILGFAQGLQAQRISIPLRTDRGAEQRVVRHRAGVGMSMQLSFSTLRVDVDMALNGQRFASLSLDGAYPAGIEGCPALPAVRRLVGIPHGATPTVRLVAHRVQEIALSDHGIRQPVAPLQPPRRKGLPLIVCLLLTIRRPTSQMPIFCPIAWCP